MKPNDPSSQTFKEAQMEKLPIAHAASPDQVMIQAESPVINHVIFYAIDALVISVCALSTKEVAWPTGLDTSVWRW